MPTGETVTLEKVWGQRVAARRTALTFSQRTLADLAETTQATIWKVEHGEITPRDSLKVRIARALGCPVDSLFSWKDAA